MDCSSAEIEQSMSKGHKRGKREEEGRSACLLEYKTDRRAFSTQRHNGRKNR